MEKIKRCFLLLLCVAAVFTICGCQKKGSSSGGGGGGGGNSSSDTAQEIFTVSEEDAVAKCESFMDELISGGFAAANDMIPMGEIIYKEDEPAVTDGIINEMMAQLNYTITEKAAQDDGSMLIKLEIENVDLKELLLSLPEEISSKEEARAKMKELLPTAARKTFEAEIYIVSYGDDIEPKVIITQSFANAMTGGINDIITELFAEETTDEEND